MTYIGKGTGTAVHGAVDETGVRLPKATEQDVVDLMNSPLTYSNKIAAYEESPLFDYLVQDYMEDDRTAHLNLTAAKLRTPWRDTQPREIVRMAFAAGLDTEDVQILTGEEITFIEEVRDWRALKPGFQHLESKFGPN